MLYDYERFAPAMIADLRRATRQLHATVLDSRIRVLVELRVSQLNSCAFCINKHAREAARLAVPIELIVGLSGWRDDHRYDERLRSALAWADALTERPEQATRDRAYADLPTQFSPEEIVHLTLAIALAQAWNRIAGGLRRQPTALRQDVAQPLTPISASGIIPAPQETPP